jgi:benzoate membrane transport protein
MIGTDVRTAAHLASAREDAPLSPDALHRLGMSAARRRRSRGIFADLSPAAATAGITTFIWYGFGLLPLQLEIAGHMNLSAGEASSAIFIVWFASAVTSILLGLYYRLPLPIAWTMPGLVYLGTLDGQFSVGQIAVANLVAGVAILVFGGIGLGKRMMVWLPLPIVMGMFAGSILIYVTRMVNATIEHMGIAGVTVAAYLAGRLIASPRIPPMVFAVAAGGIAIAITGTSTPGAIVWTPPTLVVPDFQFSFDAVLAISLPMIVLTLGLGNVQGLGFLVAQGYRVPVTPVTVAVGLTSIVNALFGGHAATVARSGVVIVAGADAGAPEHRYWASLIAGALTLLIAVAAGAVGALVDVLPGSFIITLAALAILSSLQDALEKAFAGRLRFGALAAFAVAATPFTIFGITSAFWSVFAGIAASLFAERTELFDHWRHGAPARATARAAASGAA